jgi:hypothetical protein
MTSIPPSWAPRRRSTPALRRREADGWELTDDERAAINEAVAAGKVRRVGHGASGVPDGVLTWDPQAHMIRGASVVEAKRKRRWADALSATPPRKAQ